MQSENDKTLYMNDEAIARKEEVKENFSIMNRKKRWE